MIDYGLMVLTRQVFGWPLVWAVALGGVVGAIVNFSLNRYWTFTSGSGTHVYSNAFLIKLAKFALTVAGSIVLKYLGTYLLEHHVGIDYKIGKLIADLFVSVLFNYPLQRFWVFHKTRP